MSRSTKQTNGRRSVARKRPGAARWRRFWRNERGVAAVELAFILPVLVLMLSGVIQLGSLIFLQNHMSNVARDVARRVAVNDLTETQGETQIQNDLYDWGINYTVTVTLPNPLDPNDTDVVVNISAPMSDVISVSVGASSSMFQVSLKSSST